jgi:PAS domain S-box-containing protein
MTGNRRDDAFSGQGPGGGGRVASGRRELERRIRLERLVARISAGFVGLPPDGVDDAINDALARIGSFVGADRAYVFIFESENTLLFNTHEWSDEGIEPQRDGLQGLPAESFPWWTERILNLETVVVRSLDELPARSRRLREILESGGISSVLAVPLSIRGEAVGFLGFDSSRRNRSWSDDSIMVLKLVAQTIASALEHRRTGRELLRHRKFLEDVLDAIQDGISVRDTDLTVTHINSWMDRKYAHRRPILGRKCYKVFQSRDSVCPWCPAVRAMETGVTQRSVNVPYPSETQPTGWLELSAFPMRDSEGEITGVIEHVKEVTERHRAREEVVRRRKFLEGVLESVPDAIVTLDSSHHIIDWNSGAEELFGYSAEEAAGRNIDDLITGPDNRDEARGYTRTVLQGRRVPPVETVRYRRDGSPVQVLLSGSPIVVDGSLIGVVAVYTDLTELRRIEAELARQRRLEALGTLAGGIAHDFNNLLSGVFGNVSLAAASLPEDSPARQHLQAVERAMDRAIGLTHQLLTFAKGSDPVVAPMDLPSLLADSVAFNLAGSSVRAELDLPEDLPPVMGDSRQLDEVVSNLVINAKEAMPDGGGTLRVSAREHGDGLIRILFADDGVGVEEEHLDRVFEPYFSTKSDGSGLGLAVVHSIVSKHGGGVTLESEPGSGTTVTVDLPAASPQDGRTPPPRQEEGKAAAVPSARVLVMDDEALVREVAEGMLASLGHRVSLAADGEEAVRMYREAMECEDGYDLVFLDLTVPGGMGGRETAEELLKIDPGASLVVSSGYATDPVMARYRDNGFSGVLAKPYSLEEMSELLSEILG